MDALGVEADKLFSLRKSADRAFYRAKDAFDAADKASKSGLKTREAYELTRKQVTAAEAEYETRKAEQKGLSERMSREERAERVAQS